MRYYSTSTFRKDLLGLCKKAKNGYSTIRKDICNQYSQNTTFNEAVQYGDTLTSPDEDDIKIFIKARVANSGRNIGKSGAFRVLYIVDKVKEEVHFLHVYPKTGAF